MKQYRDMTDKERAKADREWAELQDHYKMSAEVIMEIYDRRPQHIRDRMKDGIRQ